MPAFKEKLNEDQITRGRPIYPKPAKNAGAVNKAEPAQSSICNCPTALIEFIGQRAPVAQLDRVSDFESEGRKFESCRVYHLFTYLLAFCRIVSIAKSKFKKRSVVKRRPGKRMDGSLSILRDKRDRVHAAGIGRNAVYRTYHQSS